MKIVKPNWVNHDGQPIFSIDTHPDGSRMATSGQGDDSGKIVIWNMGPIINKSKEIDENVPKILCQMDHHMGCVNTVRWSNNGQFLASGADDKLVMIWQYVPSPTYQNIENWKCAFTLRGHSGDVLDLAWSFNDAYLASSSIDNYIFIWNVHKFPDIVARINAHNGFVKGITWDPIGQYIASQSDDKTLKIWKTSDWTLEKTIDEPFKKCGNTTHLLRLNWSPDGQLLISAHAMNNNAPTAQVIERCGWKTKLDFIGHRQAITCVKFYPQILKQTNGNADKTYCLCAVGSRDKALSIWLTNYTRPISVVYDLFTNPVMDITWCKEPCGLLCCSMDGTVAYIELNQSEVGFPLTKNEMDQFYKLKYSYDLNADIAKCHSQATSTNNNVEVSNKLAASAASNQNKFIENIDVLLAQENATIKMKQKQQEQAQQLQISNVSLSGSASSDSNYSQLKRSSSVENQKQIERKMGDGRRRITPICISKTNEFETPKPFDSVNNLRSQTATEQSTIVIEKRDERGEIIDISPVKHVSYTLKPSSINSNSNDTQFYLAIKQKQQQQQQTVTNTQQTQENTEQQQQKQEMKQPERDQPQPQKQQVQLPKPQEQAKAQHQQSQSHTTPKLPPQTTPPNHNNNVNKAQTQQQSATIKKPPFQTPTAPPATTTNGPNQIKSQTPNTTTLNKQPQPQQQTQSATTRSQPQKRPIQQTQQQQQQQPQTPTVNGTSHPKPATLKSSDSVTPVGVTNDDDDTNRSKMRRILKTSPSIHLLPLKFEQNRVTKQISTKIGDKSSSTEIEIENSINDQRTLNCVKYIKDRVCKWKQVITSEIIAIAHSQHIIACASHDRCLYIINILNGKQICCPLLVDDQVASLKLNNSYCLCLTCNATIYIWKYDIEQIQSILNQSCVGVVRDGHFINSTITENGIPVIYMSNSRTYFYSFQTQSWHLIPSLNNELSVNSYIESFNKDQPLGPLSQIQVKDSSTDIIKTIDQVNKNDTLKQDCTINYLESQINASLAFNSSKEYKFWLQTYVRYLCENSYEDKLKDLCNYLLGPIYSIKWNPKILDLNKRDILSDILNIIINYTSFERIYTQYRQQLSSINTNTSILNGIVNNYETSNKTIMKVNGEQAPAITATISNNDNQQQTKPQQQQQLEMQTD